MREREREREREEGGRKNFEVSHINFLQKVNTQLKRSDNELAKLNSIMEQVGTDTQTFAPNINIEVSASPKKSPSPLFHKLRQRQGKVPSLFLRNPFHDPSTGIEERVPEARPEGQGGSTPPKPS